MPQAEPQPSAGIHATLARVFGYHEFRPHQQAIPLHRALPTVFRFGWRNFALRLRLLGTFLTRVRQAHLDYEKPPTP